MRTVRGNRTHDEILSAATTVVLESGQAGFSMREVARRTGLAPSALYNHFPGRDALIVAVALRALGGLTEYLGAVSETDSQAQVLRRLASAYVAFAEEHPAEYRLVFECLESPATTWDRYLTVAEPFTLIVAACERGLRTGEFVDRVSAGAGGMAYALWALCHGHASLTSRNLVHVEGDFESLAMRGVDALLAGYAERD